MNDLELWTWTSFPDVVKNLLGNHQAKIYKLEKLLISLQDVGVNRSSIKIHFLHRNQDKFEWWARRMIPSEYQSNGRALPGTVGQTNDGWQLLDWFGLVSLFNGISTFVGYLMPKLFSLKNSSGTI